MQILSILAIIFAGIACIVACGFLFVSTFGSPTMSLIEEFARRGLGCILFFVGLFFIAWGSFSLLVYLGGGA